MGKADVPRIEHVKSLTPARWIGLITELDVYSELFQCLTI